MAAPVFQPYRSDDTVVRNLTRTQVALHEQRSALSSLREQAARDKADWDSQRQHLEELVLQIQVQHAEAERLVKAQLADLTASLHSTEGALESLDHDHRTLRSASTATINELRDRAEALRSKCSQLEADKTSLEDQLATAMLDAAQKQAAEARVRELEAGLDAVKRRAQQVIESLEAQRAAAGAEAGALGEELSATQQALGRQAALQRHHEGAALALAVDRARLLAELQVERLINEPLRHTDHASTTLAHVMRSGVAATVADRARNPTLITTAYQPPHSSYPAGSPDVTTVARPGSAPAEAPAALALIRGVFGEGAGRQAGGADAGVPVAVEAGGAATMPAGLPAGFGVPVNLQPSPARVSGGGPAMVSVSHVDMSTALAGKPLTMLGRSWATTTATAGEPHPAFLDNVSPARAQQHSAPAQPPYSPFASPSARRVPPSAQLRGAQRSTPAHVSAGKEFAAKGTPSPVAHTGPRRPVSVSPGVRSLAANSGSAGKSSPRPGQSWRSQAVSPPSTARTLQYPRADV